MSTIETHLRTVVGVMSGTSIDAIDVAAASISGRGLSMRAKLVVSGTTALGPLAGDLRRAAGGEPMPAEAFAALGEALGRRYADAIAEAAGCQAPFDLIAVHGQTIIHRPPLSWQLLNPAPIVRRFRCPVVSDLRQSDLAAGGRGAPITPLADRVLFAQDGVARLIVNLGGFCNVTVLSQSRSHEGAAEGFEERPGRMPGIPTPQPRPAGRQAAWSTEAAKAQLRRQDAKQLTVYGFDLCACNHVLDQVARETLGAEYDAGGRAAAHGRPHSGALASLAALLARQCDERRSLGSGDEPTGWVAAYRGRVPAEDLAATAVEAVAATIADALGSLDADEVIIAGGGTQNAALVDALRHRIPRPVRLSDALGVPAKAREAMAMAVLGALCADGVPITLPRITGCHEATVAGSWWLPDGFSSTKSFEG